ncbi:hypothetical protein NFI96_006833 [Prochilodus magdalenae]|nr:hypothetical protein NFI96_006833 [Prochilodus magdalenae]
MLKGGERVVRLEWVEPELVVGGAVVLSGSIRDDGWSYVDHMFIEDFVEDDEEPPLLLHSCPPDDVSVVCVYVCEYGCGTLCLYIQLLGPWGALAGPCQWGEECACLRCPAGQEPSMACSEVDDPDIVVECQLCPPGTFSDTLGPELCRPHSACRSLNRWTVAPPTSRSDSVCGACLPGFQPVAPGKASAPHACVRMCVCVVCVSASLKRLKRNAGKSAPLGSGVGVANATNVRSPEEKNTEYAVFALVPIFCVMGLLGILICNLLKKKGYNCTAEKEAGDEEAATPRKEVSADGAVGVEVEGHQAFWTCDSKPFILVLTTVPPHTDSLGVSTKTKAGLVTEDDPLPF